MPGPVRTGTVIAGFRIESLLAEGAMGAVYLAEERAAGQRVALKVLSPELARDERFRQRFLRESEVAASLHHAHVVPTVAAGEEDGVLYLAMAYVNGPDLRAVLRREGRLDAGRAVEIVSQAAQALDAAHAEGLVHRDVKPGNILVSTAPDGGGDHVYVCDFGLARHVSSVSSLTGERGFVGTIDYVPPEQIEGGRLDARADVYSLGCVLYECLVGKKPFERDSELSVVFAHLNEPPPRATDERPELPEAFDAVFATALAKAPDDRYATCGELAKAARAALRGRRLARRRAVRRRLVLAGAALVIVSAAVVSVLAATGGTSASHDAQPAQIALAAGALNVVDAKSHRVVGTVPSAPGTLAFTAGSAWLLSPEKQLLSRVDLRTLKVDRRIALPWQSGELATSGGAVWVGEDFGSRFWRIEPTSGKVVSRFTVPDGGINGAAYGDGSLWLARSSEILRVDPRTGRVLRHISAPAQRLLYADGFLWSATPGDGRVAKIDPASNAVVARQKLHGWLSDIAVGGGSLWAAVAPDGDVFRLSEDDLGVQSTRAVGLDPEQISFGGGRLWVANTAARALSSVEQVSGTRQQFRTMSEPMAAVYHAGRVWTVTAAAPKPLPPIRGQELRISTPTDTAVDPDPMGEHGNVDQFMYATCANLLRYPDLAGAAGARPQPEIAAAMPTVSNGGRTYTFRIRDGFRFSPPSNESVTAETFRHTLERSLSPKNVYSTGPFWLPDVAGVSAYRAGRAAHISGISASGNRLSITLVKPDGDFLTRLSMFPFCPVPLSVPTNIKGFTTKPRPSAGPYYLESLENHRAVLLRNPNYHGDRPRRSARIVYTNDVPTPEAVSLANEGALDLLPQDFDNTTPLLYPGEALDRLYGSGSAAARHGKQQLYLYDAPFLDYIVLNAGRPVFRDVRVRRAVNYALDRRALGRAYFDAPADVIVPPAVPDFRAGRVYPVGPPDVATGRRLAGGRSRHAVLYWCGPDERQRTLARIIQRDLARIRIAVFFDHAQKCVDHYDARAKAADLLLAGNLGSQELDAQPFLEQALATDGRYGTALGRGLWTTSTFRRRLAHAKVLRGDARLRAYAKLVTQLTRAAPFAVYGSFLWSQYFSPQVGCRLFQGEHHFVDIGALCKS